MLSLPSPTEPTRADAADQAAHIATAVRSYCHRKGYSASTTVSAIAWALRSPGTTLLQIGEGNKRADVLHSRSQPAPVPA